MRKLLHANVSCLRYDRAFWLLAALMDRRFRLVGRIARDSRGNGGVFVWTVGRLALKAAGVFG